MKISTKKLGLAAYVKIQGIRFLGYQSELGFSFESDKSEPEWFTEYMNTEAYRHDVELMNLRKLLR